MRLSERLLLISLSLLLFVAALPPAFGQTCSPDINADGKVDTDDAQILYLVFTTPVEEIGTGRGDGSGGGISRTVSIAAQAPTVVEGSPAVFVLTASQTASAVTTYVGLSVTGDFEVLARTRTVEIADGETTATLSVDTVDDTSAEVWGTVTATVGCATHSLVGTPSTAAVAIADDDVTILIMARTSIVLEGSPVEFVLTTSEAPPTAFTVGVEVSITGAFGVATGTRMVAFEAHATTATLRVDTLGDSIDEKNDTVTAALQPGLGYAVGAPATTSVAIVDDDVTISLKTQAKSVSEGSDAVFVLKASKPPLTTFTVGVEVSATGSNHGVSAGPWMVAFEVFATTATLRVETPDNSVDEENGAVTAELQAGDGYGIGSPSTATVVVVDDDQE